MALNLYGTGTAQSRSGLQKLSEHHTPEAGDALMNPLHKAKHFWYMLMQPMQHTHRFDP
jgi:hypothetical protein